MPETRVSIAGQIHRLNIEYGERAVLVVEVECTAEGQHRTKNGDVPTRKVTVSDALRLHGDLPDHMLTELRRQRREAEGEETGVEVLAGLEGFLDSNGVVVTEADRIDRDELADDESAAITRWRELGQRVHHLREQLADGGPSSTQAQVELDNLWADLNQIVEGDIVEENVIIDEDGNERPPIDLPDIPFYDPAAAKVDDEPPFDGYEDLDADGIVEHVDEYIDADAALGGPSTEARSYVERVRAYEAAHEARVTVLGELEARLAAIDAALADAPAEVPWESYDGTSADGVIQHLKDVAENDGADVARALVNRVDAYEAAHKKRKGVLGRLAGIVPPELPDGPDLELELDEDDEFEPDDETLVEDTADIASVEG